MNYEETVKKICSYERCGIRLGLDRIKKLLELMGNPQDKVMFIHVAGTNGKGSICTIISSVMKECGHKTGLYLSPGVEDFRERIQVNGKMIDKVSLVNTAKKVFDIIENIKDDDFKITAFEIITAIAFQYFMKQKCDIVVLETGLGGRLDATNVIKSPIVSVITSISFDHTNILGDTLEKIAFEKSGIIKENCPVVVYPDQDECVINVIKNQAELRKSPVFIARKEDVKYISSDLFLGTKFWYDKQEYTMSFLGEHQLKNVATALLVLKIIGKYFSISKEGVAKGIENARIPARIELLSKNPVVLLDGAHNVSGVEVLRDVLLKNCKSKNLIGIVGMLRDKDVETSFSKILPIFKKLTLVKPDNKRAMDLHEESNIAKKYNKNISYSLDLEDTLKLELSMLDKNDILVIFGSLYLCSDVKSIMRKVNLDIK